MASRTTISMASKIGGCSVNDFFEKLQPLGFGIDKLVKPDTLIQSVPRPEFMKNMTPENTSELDVRALLDEGKDPFNLIREKTNQLHPNQILKLINSFEPLPLIQILEKQGFQSYTEIINDNLVHTYFSKSDKVISNAAEPQINKSTDDWDTILHRYKEKLKIIDVRELEMPLPMLTILDELDKLPDDLALYVYHKRIPVFLLPELQERKFDYRIKEISESEVHLLIFKA